MKILIIIIMLFLIILINPLQSATSPSLNSWNGEIFYNTGNQYFNQQKYAEVIKFYEKAIAAGYENDEMYYKLSISYSKVKKYIEAMNCIAKAVQLLENTIKNKFNKS